MASDIEIEANSPRCRANHANICGLRHQPWQLIIDNYLDPSLNRNLSAEFLISPENTFAWLKEKHVRLIKYNEIDGCLGYIRMRIQLSFAIFFLQCGILSTLDWGMSGGDLFG